MKMRDSRRGAIVYIVALILLSAAVLVCSFFFLGGSGKNIDDIIHEHDDEDRYAGLGGRPTIEAELDYMILKYSNGVDPLREEDYEDDQDEDDDQQDDQDKDDDQQDDQDKDDDQQDDQDKDDDQQDDQDKDDDQQDDQDKDDNQQDDQDKDHDQKQEADPDWKDKIFAMYRNVDTEVTLYAPKEVVFDEIFEALDIECRYKTGEDGIFLASYSYRTTEKDDYNIWDLRVGYSRDVAEIRKIKDMTAEKEDAEQRTLDVSGLSDADKISLVNEFVCDYTNYTANQPYPDQSHTAYGALFEKECVCDGYSRLVKMICDDIGIDCYIVIGDVINAGGHAWNLVKIDGKWYHLDVTWNDGCGDRHGYYLIPDSYLEEHRVWNHDLYPKVATAPYIR